MKAIGIIIENEFTNDKLEDLTWLRSAAAMPVGAGYRAIDFSLSNMAHSNISKVAVITQYNSRSLQDHLSSAKWWDLGRKQGGLFMFTPYASSNSPIGFKGTADALHQNISYLKRSNEPYVIISFGDSVYKMEFQDLIDYHQEKDADVTVVYKQFLADKDLTEYDILELYSDGRVLNIEEKPLEPLTHNAALGIYCVSRILLIKYLEMLVKEGRYDLMRDMFIRFRKRLKIFGYKHEGYWSSVGLSVKDYFDTNMDFLKKDVRDVFIREYPFISTKPKDEPPVKYNYKSNVMNSLVGSGSIINGSVNSSILFRKVVTGDNSKVNNSIIMEGSFIGNGCVVEHAIIDKEVVLTDGKIIVGTEQNPIIIKKGTVM